MFKKTAAAAASVAVLSALGGAANAEASCYASTPATATYTDSISDGESGLAPELGTIQASVNATCGYSVDPQVADGLLISGDSVFVYVNTDGNPATGSATFGGADRAIGTLGSTGGDEVPMMGTWNAATQTMDFAGGQRLTARGVGGFSASLDQLGIANPANTTVLVASMYDGMFDNYFDWAPNVGESGLSLPVGFSTLAPPPPPAPVAPAAPAAAVSKPASLPVVTKEASSTGCVVPAVRKLTLATAKRRLVASKCVVGLTRRAYSSTIRRGRVISSSPGRAGRTTGFVKLTVSLGRKPRRRAHAAAAGTAATLERLAAALEAQRG